MNVRATPLLALLLASALSLAVAPGAMAEPQAVAHVNGRPILRSQLEERIRDLHRYRPRVRAEGEASTVALVEIVQAMADERLMVQEAERLGLDRTEPVRRALESFTSDQAVLRLRQLEVLDQAQVSDEEVLAVLQMRPGAENSTDQVRERSMEHIRKSLQRRKIQERSTAYVENLAALSSLEISRDTLAALEPGREPQDGECPVARLGKATITARQVQSEMDRIAGNRQFAVQRSHSPEDYAAWLDRVRESALQALTTPLLVAAEAHRRGLDKEPEILDLAASRRDGLLVQALLQEVIAPLAEPSEEEMRAYLASHPEEFRQDSDFRFAQMRFSDQDEARSVLNELQQGAGFEYLAKQTDSQNPMETSRVWTPGRDLAPEVRQELASLQPGAVSGIVSDGRGFVLLKLKGRRGGEPLPFAAAKEGLRLAVGRLNFARIRVEYLERLRETADITIHHEVLEGMEAAFWRPEPDSGNSPVGEP